MQNIIQLARREFMISRRYQLNVNWQDLKVGQITEIFPLRADHGRKMYRNKLAWAHSVHLKHYFCVEERSISYSVTQRRMFALKWSRCQRIRCQNKFK